MPLADVEEATFDRIIAVNLRSIFLCMKYEIRQMLAQGAGGAIVNIASTNSFRPQPNQSAYTASKHGVLGMTRNAAIDYAGHGIRINAICPGAIDTPMLRAAIERRGREPEEVAGRLSLLGRFGDAGEIAKAALWLCSDAVVVHGRPRPRRRRRLPGPLVERWPTGADDHHGFQWITLDGSRRGAGLKSVPRV